jgi:hypothetical protein
MNVRTFSFIPGNVNSCATRSVHVSRTLSNDRALIQQMNIVTADSVLWHIHTWWLPKYWHLRQFISLLLCCVVSQTSGTMWLCKKAGWGKNVGEVERNFPRWKPEAEGHRRCKEWHTSREIRKITTAARIAQLIQWPGYRRDGRGIVVDWYRVLSPG